jgi:rhomboid protease GluP
MVHWLSVAIAASLAVPLLAPLVRRRHACLLTVVWNFMIFVVMYIAGLAQPGLYDRIVYDLGFDTSLLGDPWQWYRAVTAMYVHAGALHVLMNMLILTLMGVPFEDRIGTGRWMAIYLVSGIIGALVDAGFALAAGQVHVGIGASGAIFGIMGAFAYLYPRDEIPMVLGFIFLQRVPVVWAVLFMALIESLYLFGVSDNIGHIVHVASLIAGVAIAVPLGRMKKKEDGKRLGTGLDLGALHGLVVNEETAALYEKIAREDVPEVRQAWLDQLVKKARCPRCHKPLAHSPGRFFCKCGFELRYLK